jgi:hypothetical protein
VHNCEQTKTLRKLIPDGSKQTTLHFGLTRSRQGILKRPVDGLYRRQTSTLAVGSFVESNDEIEDLITNFLN